MILLDAWYKHLIPNALIKPVLAPTLTEQQAPQQPPWKLISFEFPRAPLFLDVDPIFKSGLAWRRIFRVQIRFVLRWIFPSKDDAMICLSHGSE